MEPVIQEFVRLTIFGNLAGPKETPDGPPTMVDQLEFETTISGSVSPQVVFSPPGCIQLIDAGLVAGATRRDFHKLTVGLAVPTIDMPQRGGHSVDLFLCAALDGQGRQHGAGGGKRPVNQALNVQKLFKRTLVINP